MAHSEHSLAERVGFEPTEACTSPHFECGALDHYATSPCRLWQWSRGRNGLLAASSLP